MCNHPFLVYSEPNSKDHFPWHLFESDFNTETFIRSSGKFCVLDVLLKKLQLGKHRVLIYSPWTQTLELLQKMMFLRGFNYRILTGAQTGAERDQRLAEFRGDPEIFVLLCSTHAIGEGVNLQVADTVILFESDWNPQKDKQAKVRM